MIHLDTNFLVDALIPASAQEAKLVAWLSAGETIGISAIAWGEFLCGPLSPAAEAAARRMLPKAVVLTRADAEQAATLFNQTGRRSKSFNDCCIAANVIRGRNVIRNERDTGTGLERDTGTGLVLASNARGVIAQGT